MEFDDIRLREILSNVVGIIILLEYVNISFIHTKFENLPIAYIETMVSAEPYVNVSAT